MSAISTLKYHYFLIYILKCNLTLNAPVTVSRSVSEGCHSLAAYFAAGLAFLVLVAAFTTWLTFEAVLVMK